MNPKTNALLCSLLAVALLGVAPGAAAAETEAATADLAATPAPLDALAGPAAYDPSPDGAVVALADPALAFSADPLAALGLAAAVQLGDIDLQVTIHDFGVDGPKLLFFTPGWTCRGYDRFHVYRDLSPGDTLWYLNPSVTCHLPTLQACLQIAQAGYGAGLGRTLVVEESCGNLFGYTVISIPGANAGTDSGYGLTPVTCSIDNTQVIPPGDWWAHCFADIEEPDGQ